MEVEQIASVDVHMVAHTVVVVRWRRKQDVEAGCPDTLVAGLVDTQRTLCRSADVSILTAPRVVAYARRLSKPNAKRAVVWQQIYGGMFGMMNECVSFSCARDRYAHVPFCTP